MPIFSNANHSFLYLKANVTVSTNAIGVVTGQLVVMVAVESTFLLQKDGIVIVNTWVRGRVRDLQSNATNGINIASNAKEEDVAVVTVKVTRERNRVYQNSIHPTHVVPWGLT